MLKWLRGSREDAKPRETKPGEAVRPQKLALDLAKLAERDLVVVFKHSTTCPVSFMAERQMRAFMASHPEVPVEKVLVREQRELSLQIAEWTGVQHESPQVIVLRKGTVVADASHGDVTEDYLAEATQ